MYEFYLVCFLLGATLMVCQFLLGMLGLGGHHDLDAGHHDVGGHDFGAQDAASHDAHGDAHAQAHDHHTSWFLGILTFRTLVAALTFFGIAGLTTYNQLAPLLSIAVAIAAGAAAMMIVAYTMRMLYRLKAEGNTRIDRAVGLNGKVYLTIPGARTGSGKVTLNLQNRTVEYQAITSHESLPTGAHIVVTGVVGPDTVEVIPASDSGSASHA